jgi:hypothetical protein
MGKENLYVWEKTEGILHEDEADVLEAFLLRHPELYLLSDEVYRGNDPEEVSVSDLHSGSRRI